MSFLSPLFLAAMAAAAGPTLIHLLNRRRFRTVEWAAMDFLRKAMHRNKRIMEIRDFILLLLRTLAVALFVFAMARPFFASDESAAYDGQPVHAVLAIDNSLSMGYTELDKSLLEIAKDKAKQFISDLPAGSRISVLPLADAEEWHTQNVYATAEDAIEALEQIEVLDRPAFAVEAADMSRRAAERAPNLPTKRFVIFSDLQEQTWQGGNLKASFEKLKDVQIVQVGPTRRDNTWVSDFQLQNRIADGDTTAVFFGVVRHEGSEPRKRVRVTLRINEDVVGETFIDVEHGQSRMLQFKHDFNAVGTSAEPVFVQTRLEISNDRLPHDDFRTLVIPVVSKVPVVFIDQYGENEQIQINKYGETHQLRALLAPGDEQGRNRQHALIEVRHFRAEQVTREELKDARLVVMAGVRTPPAVLVKLLREYAEQGGQVFIGAGADFDPVAWNEIGWDGGAGVLPAPLDGKIVGKIPGPEDKDKKFRLSPQSIRNDVFTLQEEDADVRAEFLTHPFFYKAVAVDEEGLKGFDEAERKRFEATFKAVQDLAAREKAWAQKEAEGELSADEAKQRENARESMSKSSPKWLAWNNPLATEPNSLSVERWVARARPTVLGRYDSGQPFAVMRHIGKGTVMMITSGCWFGWNTLALPENAFLFDSALRYLLMNSMPDRTLGPVNELVLPVAARDQAAQFSLLTPGDTTPGPMGVDALGENTYGMILRSLGKRGVYEIKRQEGDGATGSDDSTQWPMLLAVNGDSQLSELTSLTPESVGQRLGLPDVRWVRGEEKVSLEGSALFGHGIWKYLVLAVLMCLVVEMLFLAKPQNAGESK